MLEHRKQITALACLTFALLAIAGCLSIRTTQPPSSSDPLDRGIGYLMQQQRADGKWISPNYGNLKEGAAITCLVLYALAPSREMLSDETMTRLQKAVDVLVPEIERNGYVTNPNGPDYTNYASAELLVATQRLPLKLDHSIRDRLVEYLSRSQLDQPEGYSQADPDYGGWDLTGWMTGLRPTSGTNISVSAAVLEALSEFKQNPAAQAALARARDWIQLAQNDDGGFLFHPRRDHDGNKAGWLDEARTQVRSYGTATADGLRILGYLDSDREQPRWNRALEWFDTKRGLRQVPGFEHETHPGTWAEGLRFYYYYSLSKALSSFPKQRATAIAQEITSILRDEQRPNGSWKNQNARMREDDPIIATCFAVSALAHCQKWLKQ